MPVKTNRTKPVTTGKLLAVARKIVGLSQKEVADRVNCSQSNIAQIELGDYVEPETRILQELSALYQLEYVDVISYIVFERYGVDFSARATLPGNLRNIVVERAKAKLEKDLPK